MFENVAELMIKIDLLKHAALWIHLIIYIYIILYKLYIGASANGNIIKHEILRNNNLQYYELLFITLSA